MDDRTTKILSKGLIIGFLVFLFLFIILYIFKDGMFYIVLQGREVILPLSTNTVVSISLMAALVAFSASIIVL